MSLFQQASPVASKIPETLMYGGGLFSIGQWFADHANTIAAIVGITVTVVGFIMTVSASNRKEKRELEEHKANMALLAAELEKVRKG